MRGLPLLLLLGGCEKISVVVDHEPGGSANPDAIVSGALSVSPVEVDLGVLFIGESRSTTVSVTNIGDATAAVSVQVVGGWSTAYTLDSYTASPEAGETTVHALTLRPTDWGIHDVSLLIKDAVSGGQVELPVAAEVQEDNDGDGVGSRQTGGGDCDDVDPTVYAGAPDAWYDGVDSDCAGNDDFDQDGDGHAATAFGGDDCADTDATIHPGATETWYDGVDGDCAGDDDNDQDGDGHAAADHGGDDCDDTDPTVSPSAPDAGYDGVDTDCAGDDDYDQDGDGYRPPDYGGEDCDDADASVHPGAPDTWYDGVDSDCLGDDDYDQDGDGVESPADCNDTDPTVIGAAAESLNHVDDDCNGLVDDLVIRDAASGQLQGAAASNRLGDKGLLGMGPDITGDGLPDLLLGAPVSSTGYLWVVDGATATSAAGSVTAYDTAAFTGEAAGYGLYYEIGWVNGPMADVDGDGTADLIVGGSYSYYYTYGRSYLFLGGPALSGAVSASAYDVRISGDSSYSADNPRVSALGDVDGDGQADLVIGAYADSSSREDNCGSVSFFSGASLSGDDLDLADAAARIYGLEERDYLGYSLVTADLDGDGYLDAIAGAPYYDEAASSGGGIFVFAGNNSMTWDTYADDAAHAEIRGATRDLNLGEDPLAHPGDVDGDGDLDLGLTNEDNGGVWLFLGGSTLSGVYDHTAADHSLAGTAGDLGSSLVLDSDLDGDGADELVVGADGDDTAAANAGVAWVFSYASTWASALTASDARATLYGTQVDGYFGSGGAGGADLDADGLEDVALGAFADDTSATDAGVVWIVRGW